MKGASLTRFLSWTAYLYSNHWPLPTPSNAIITLKAPRIKQTLYPNPTPLHEILCCCFVGYNRSALPQFHCVKEQVLLLLKRPSAQAAVIC
jgi:hypothetical protein